MKKILWKYAAILVIGMFFLNLFANTFYWYVSIWWFDMLMHTLGGVFLALAVGAAGMNTWKKTSSHTVLIGILLAVFIIGFGWEVFEYVVQGIIKNVHLADIPDSISDLLCDMTGGLIGTFFVIRMKSRYTTK